MTPFPSELVRQKRAVGVKKYSSIATVVFQKMERKQWPIVKAGEKGTTRPVSQYQKLCLILNTNKTGFVATVQCDIVIHNFV